MEAVVAWFATLDWAAIGQIILIDILLGGDNAVVIALACRNLPARQRRLGIFWGAAGAILLRVILISFAVALLNVPALKLIGGALLIWIGVKLIAPPEEDEHATIQGSDKLWAAIKTIIVADLVMSIDNVIAIAGAAEQADPSHRTGLISSACWSACRSSCSAVRSCSNCSTGSRSLCCLAARCSAGSRAG